MGVVEGWREKPSLIEKMSRRLEWGAGGGRKKSPFSLHSGGGGRRSLHSALHQ